ncbi:tripartite tricarboxylate transporter TctB family protein [Falsirhodobacter sp. 20TX0035]|uniref:tripartite tricarboxylate transporter TctB family protein n=1 Tax=Falsirhodobacter sp. 20TX0035 TaxID=3022019 RepID=UPI00232A927E|nr:tripartite tricarboxylate transporter TctB family protein [Falsirhodobacter sp. 20TX0035]MDB6455089.1 tripartite tricarboxylate transporter TctB family protein [Falsirhodobacter sp. 20TX0035]
MITRNMVGGAVTIVIGAVYLYYAHQIRVSSLADSFGPRGLPLVYGWLTIFLGALVLGKSTVAVWRLDGEARATLAQEEWAGEGRSILRAAGLLLIATLYLLLLPHLGYPLSLVLLIGGVILYMGAARTWRVPVIALLGATMLWLIFVKLLGVDMPEGFLSTLLS